MKDQKKTKEQPISELAELRRRIAELEATDAQHKQLEQGLSYEHDLMEALFENHPDFIYFKDSKARFHRVSKHFCDFFGRNMEDIVGKTDLELFPQEVAKQTHSEDLIVIKTGIPLINKEESAAGTWVLTTKMPWFDEQGNIIGLFGISRDITKRKRMEEQMRVKDSAMASSINAIAIADLEGNLIYVNDSFTGLWGYDKEELLGKHCMQFVHNREQVEAVTEAVLKKGGWQGELVATRKDGSTFNVQLSASMVRDEAGNPACMMCSLIDITRRKRAEEEMRVKDSAMASSINAIAMADLEGDLTYVNPSFLRMWGYKNEEGVLGKPATQFWHVREQAAAIIRVLFEKGGWQGELVASRKDGSTFDVQLSASMVTDDTGKSIYMMSSFIDITERKRIEEELRESEHKYRTLVENLPQRIFLKDRNSVHVSCNANFARDLKIHPDEITGKTDYDLFPKQTAEKYMADDRKIMESGRTEEVEETYAVNGQEVSVHVLKTPVKDEGNNIIGVLGIFQDVTERKRMEQQLKDYSQNLEQMVEERTRELQDAEERYRSTFEYAGDAILVHDTDHVIRGFNRRAEEVFGYKAEEVVGRQTYDIVRPTTPAEKHEADQATAHLVAQAIKQGFYRDQEVTSYMRKDRKPFPAEASGAVIRDSKEKVIGFVSIYRDISERKQLERELADSEEKYRSLFEYAGDAIVVFDTKGVVQGWNRRAEEMFGYRAEEVVGRPWQNLMPPAESAAGREAQREAEQLVAEAGRQGFYQNREAVSYIRKDGRQFAVEATGAEIKDGEGKPIGFSAIFRDITERKRLEREREEYARRLEAKIEEVERTKSELQEAQEKLVRTEKLAAIGELAGGVGHELRNPFGAIKNAAYLLNMILTEPEPQVKEALAILEKEVTRSDRIIADLLDFSRPGKTSIVTVDINRIIQEVVQDTTLPQNVEMSTTLQKNLPPALADADQLQRALSNLVTNALQAMPDGGKVTVTTRGKDSLVEMAVTDTGVGIPEENLDKVFEPLFTTKAKGVGLGLALSRALVERQRGTLEVESEVGKGSTFTLTLPMGGKEERQDAGESLHPDCG